MDTLKKTLMWTGIVVTGLCGIVLLGGGKVTSGTLLIATTFGMMLPIGQRLPRWARIGLVCAVFGLVIWNISTTDLPAPGMAEACTSGPADLPASTGVKFLDQVRDIFNGFVSQAESS
jgi:hypothetical protein